MPGISLVYHKDGLNSEIAKGISGIFKSFGLPEYGYSLLYQSKKIHLSAFKYPEYPLYEYENDEILVVLEGDVYYGGTLDEFFTEVVSLHSYFNNYQDPDTALINTWLKKVEGDFIITIIDKEKEQVMFLNDLLGRLPVYRYADKDKFIISREIGFVTGMSEPEPDTIACAEFLLFGYPLGEKTLFENVERVGPATLLQIDDMGLGSHIVNAFNFDHRNPGIGSAEEAAGELHDLFLQSLKMRVNKGFTNILSLSGGLDSRIVLGAFAEEGISHQNVSFLDHKKEVLKDVEVAGQLVNAFQESLEVIDLPPPEKEDYDYLLKIKGGMNELGMAFIIPFFKKIKRAGMIYFTGDGGDKLLPDLRPMRKIRSGESLIRYILRYETKISLDELSSFIKVKETDLLKHIEQLLDSYPEDKYENKYKHFLIAERAMKWLFEGEDRNRYFFRSISPFYSQAFFRYAMECPDDLKKDYKLFRLFLNKFPGDIASVENANWGFSIISEKLGSMLVSKKVKAQLPDWFKRFFGKKPGGSNYLHANHKTDIVETFLRQSENTNTISGIFDVEFLKKKKMLNEDLFHHLFTLSSVFSGIEKGTHPL